MIRSATGRVITVIGIIDTKKILIDLMAAANIIHVAQMDRIMRRERRDQLSDRLGLVGPGRPISGQRDADLVAAGELVDALMRIGLWVSQKWMARPDAMRKVFPRPRGHSLR
ncbi:MAG: hypothetical protein WA858_04400 [Xanthobacteraceae bacterium]